MAQLPGIAYGKIALDQIRAMAVFTRWGHRLLNTDFTSFHASAIEFPTRLSNIARQTVREALAGLTVNLLSS